MAPIPPARRATRLALGLLLASVLLVLVGTGVGSTGLAGLGAAVDDEMARRIVLDIRLPRSLGAWLAGALLGLAGAVAQGLFRNPLADPFMLGSASGATLGVALALVLGSVLGTGGAVLGLSAGGVSWLAGLGLTGAAFAGAVGAVLLTLALARGVQHTLRLLLAGVVVGVVLGALASLLTLLAPQTLAALQSFLLGSTGFIGWTACGLMALSLVLCAAGAWVSSPVLDGLALGEATARSLGLPLAPLRAALLGVLALATGAAVAQTGLIAFVGLAAPHLVRARAAVTHARLMPLAALAGGVLLLAADIAARSGPGGQEWPVGVLTAVLGGGYLLWRMHRAQGTGGLA